MNIKSWLMGTVILARCVVLAEGFASVESSNVFGVLRVDSTLTRTLLAVPWCDVSAVENSAITVSSIVKTTNLTPGDTLHALNDDRTVFNSWELTEGAGGNLVWQSVNQVSTNGVVTTTASASDVHSARGNGLIIIRQHPNQPFYIYGQVGNTASVTTTILGGSTEEPAHNLIAPPCDHDVHLTDAEWTGSIGENDEIYIPKPNGLYTILRYKNGVWKYSKRTAHPVVPGAVVTSWVEFTDSIPAGTGFWYISYGGSPTITWNNVPSYR